MQLLSHALFVRDTHSLLTTDRALVRHTEVGKVELPGPL